MKEKPVKKIFGKPKPLSLPPKPSTPQLPKPVPLKALESGSTKSSFSREIFEPIISRPRKLDQFATEVIFRLHDADGYREIRSCYGDIYKVINALMDYARLLELVCDEWNLQGYHRALYELDAEKLRSIAKKYQTAIGYDYDAAVARCEAKRKRQHKDDDVDGSYGENDFGIFFFTPDGKYVEWTGTYLYSDIPFEVDDPVVRVGG